MKSFINKCFPYGVGKYSYQQNSNHMAHFGNGVRLSRDGNINVASLKRKKASNELQKPIAIRGQTLSGGDY